MQIVFFTYNVRNGFCFCSCLLESKISTILWLWGPCVLLCFLTTELKKLSENRYPVRTQICTPWCFLLLETIIDRFSPLSVLVFSPHICTQIGIFPQWLKHMLCLLHEFRKLRVYFPVLPHSSWSPSHSIHWLALLNMHRKKSKKNPFPLSTENGKQLQHVCEVKIPLGGDIDLSKV